jgi:hypothetical protein
MAEVIYNNISIIFPFPFLIPFLIPPPPHSSILNPQNLNPQSSNLDSGRGTPTLLH